MISWDATFSTRSGVVELASDNRMRIRRGTDGRAHTWKIKPDRTIVVAEAQDVDECQVIASTVPPILGEELHCACPLTPDRIERLLCSRERTQRFTGVKLARLLSISDFADTVDNVLQDREEDVYVRLEAASYLAATCGAPIAPLFEPFYKNRDEQTRLEAVIAIGEAATMDAVEILSDLLDSADNPYYLRSAAAWCLSRINSEEPSQILIKAFGGVDPTIREEALKGIVNLGEPAVTQLLEGLRGSDIDVAAGCAESLRQQQPHKEHVIDQILSGLDQNEPPLWNVWLVGNLPRDMVAAKITRFQETDPKLHYALSVLWCFMESWIAKRWEADPRSETMP